MGSRNVERDKPIIDEHTSLAKYAREFPDWAFNVFCRSCAHGARLQPERLLAKLGSKARVGDVIARLKCRKCRSQISYLKPVFVGKRRD